MKQPGEDELLYMIVSALGVGTLAYFCSSGEWTYVDERVIGNRHSVRAKAAVLFRADELPAAMETAKVLHPVPGTAIFSICALDCATLNRLALEDPENAL
jgi:hypothetical protein